MFAFLRYFALGAFALVVGAAYVLGMYFRETAEADLETMVHKNNKALIQGFTNTVWDTHRPVFKALQNVERRDWNRYRQYRDFETDVFGYFEDSPVAKLNLYTNDGRRFLYTDQSGQILFDARATRAESLLTQDVSRLALADAQKGIDSHNVLSHTEYTAPDGSRRQGTLIESFIPLMPEGFTDVVAGTSTEPEAIIQIYYDVTPQWLALEDFQNLGTSGIVALFFLLVIALYFTSQRAEMIIARQHEKTLDLTAAAARAEAASAEKSQFLANISHELRTPLNAIIGFSEIIKNEVMGPLGNTQYMDYVRDIHASGSHLLSLINDILDYSKAEADKLELEIADVDATKILKSSMRLIEPRAEAAGVHLVAEIPKEHYVLKTDAKKLKQIMLNLLSNAVKFTPQEGTVKVTVWHDVKDESLTIEVADSGIGIAPKDISKALAPFGQVDSELSRKYEGTGLGLPLTKKFIEIMGGKFVIQSELGTGTTITFTLPKEAPAKHWKKTSNVKKKQEAPKAVTPDIEPVGPAEAMRLDTTRDSSTLFNDSPAEASPAPPPAAESSAPRPDTASGGLELDTSRLASPKK